MDLDDFFDFCNCSGFQLLVMFFSDGFQRFLIDFCDVRMDFNDCTDFHYFRMAFYDLLCIVVLFLHDLDVVLAR